MQLEVETLIDAPSMFMCASSADITGAHKKAFPQAKVGKLIVS